jgi:poly(A) polymerase
MKGISNTFICLTEEEQAAASQGELGIEAMRRREEDYAVSVKEESKEDGDVVGGNALDGVGTEGASGSASAEGKGYRKIWTKNFFIGLEIEKRPSELVSHRRLDSTGC